MSDNLENTVNADDVCDTMYEDFNNNKAGITSDYDDLSIPAKTSTHIPTESARSVDVIDTEMEDLSHAQVSDYKSNNSHEYENVVHVPDRTIHDSPEETKVFKAVGKNDAIDDEAPTLSRSATVSQQRRINTQKPPIGHITIGDPELEDAYDRQTWPLCMVCEDTFVQVGSVCSKCQGDPLLVIECSSDEDETKDVEVEKKIVENTSKKDGADLVENVVEKSDDNSEIDKDVDAVVVQNNNVVEVTASTSQIYPKSCYELVLYQCLMEFCKLCFKNQDLLLKHLKNKGRSLRQPKSHNCIICKDISFDSIAVLKLHKSLHSKYNYRRKDFKIIKERSYQTNNAHEGMRAKMEDRFFKQKE